MSALMRWPAVRLVTGISRSHAWRLEKAGLFPRRRQLSKNAVAWVDHEIQQWIAARKPVGSQS
jgi:prophage regulatory protein